MKALSVGIFLSLLEIYSNIVLISVLYFIPKVLAASAHIPGLSVVSMLNMATGRGRFSYVPLPASRTAEVPWCLLSGWSQRHTVSKENLQALSS